MKKNKKLKLEDFTLDELKVVREVIVSSGTQEELFERVDKIIKSKEKKLVTSLNANFPVSWFNIDQEYIALLYRNGIATEAQLLEVEDISTLEGITEMGKEQITWAREFFNMEPLDQMPKKKKEDQMEVAKVIVKHAQEVNQKHNV